MTPTRSRCVARHRDCGRAGERPRRSAGSCSAAIARRAHGCLGATTERSSRSERARFAEVPGARESRLSRRIVHHMVLGELCCGRYRVAVARSRARRTPRRSASRMTSCAWRAATRRVRTGSRGSISSATASSRTSVSPAAPTSLRGRPRARGAVANVRGPTRRNSRALRVRDVRGSRLRVARNPEGRTGLPRPARLRARARRLRHEPAGRARGVRAHRPR